MEAHLPEANSQVVDEVRAIVAAVSAIPETINAAISGIAEATEKNAQAIEALRDGIVKKLDHVATGVYADRVPVFDKDGNPTRSRLDIH